MEFYHWLVLVLIVALVFAIFTRVAGGLLRTIISIVAIIIFAGFVWGTMPQEHKDYIQEIKENNESTVVDIVKAIFDYGQTLPEKQQEATQELYK